MTDSLDKDNHSMLSALMLAAAIYWQAENPRLRHGDGGQYRMDAHPNDVLLAKPAKIAATEKQLGRTNNHPDRPGLPIFFGHAPS